MEGDLVDVRLFVGVRVSDRLAVCDRLVDGLELIDFDDEIEAVADELIELVAV